MGRAIYYLTHKWPGGESDEKQINKRLCIIIFAAMLVSLLLNYLLQIFQAEDAMRAGSQELFWQINQILVQNEKEVEQIKEDFAKNCLVNAKAAAYIVQNKPDIINDQDELQKLQSYSRLMNFIYLIHRGICMRVHSQSTLA